MADDETAATAELDEVVVATAADPGVTENPPADTVDVPTTEPMIGAIPHPDTAAVDDDATGDNEGWPAQPGVPAGVPDTDGEDAPKARRSRKAS